MMPAQQLRARGPFRGNAPSSAVSPSAMVMPYDHAASFELKGVPGNIVQDVINISSDGSFVAVGIGYGFEEDRARPAPLVDPPTANFKPGELTLSDVPIAALIEGFRLNPRFERLIFDDLPGGRASAGRERTFSNKEIAESHSSGILERLKPAEEISFLFSILDSATGRELQDEPIHNLASLGNSSGSRPFRMLAKPLTFQPQSTVRLQIIERSESIKGTLFIVLYGYKTLGPGGPRPNNPPAPNNIPGPSGRVIPFDYVATFPLTGSPGNQIEAEIPINVEGGFVATSIGYGLAVESLNVSVANPRAALGTLKLSQFPTSALQDGIRIRPGCTQVAFANGELATVSQIDLVNRIFERMNRPDDVSFRYSIFDGGTGRELQNQPINNIAGLGIANGDRPFKRFAQPMLFVPRSTIRVTVEERFGRGNLFMVFQGYKVIGGSATQPGPVRRARR